MRLFVTTALACSLAFAAQAQNEQHPRCPTGPEDLRDTISIRYHDATWSYLTALEDGLVEDRAIVNRFAGEGQLSISRAGVFVFEETPLMRNQPVAEESRIIEYSEDVAALPTLEPGLTWETTVQVVSQDSEPFERTVTLTVGQPEEADYGDCFYESWPVEVRNSGASEDVTLGYDYLPLLETAIFRSYDGGQPFPENYLPVLIRTAEGMAEIEAEIEAEQAGEEPPAMAQ